MNFPGFRTGGKFAVLGNSLVIPTNPSFCGMAYTAQRIPKAVGDPGLLPGRFNCSKSGRLSLQDREARLGGPQPDTTPHLTHPSVSRLTRVVGARRAGGPCEAPGSQWGGAPCAGGGAMTRTPRDPTCGLHFEEAGSGGGQQHRLRVGRYR